MHAVIVLCVIGYSAVVLELIAQSKFQIAARFVLTIFRKFLVMWMVLNNTVPLPGKIGHTKGIWVVPRCNFHSVHLRSTLLRQMIVHRM